MEQLGIAMFGLTALWLSMGNSHSGRKWAPLIGLAGQPFWLLYALKTNGWGLGLLVAAYTAVYLRGAWIQWKEPVS